MSDTTRDAAEHAYIMTAFDYANAPVGSRDWVLYWRGWQAALAGQGSDWTAGQVDADGEPLVTITKAKYEHLKQPAQGDEPNRGQLKPHDGGSIAPGYTAPPAQGGPTCPHCKTVMRPVHFVGYYDEFHFWSCDCEILPNAVKERGGYA